MYYVNENLPALYRIFDDTPRSGFLRLDLNENPVGLPEALVERVRASITPETLAMYPEQATFKGVLAPFLGVAPEQICLTNGSSEVIRYIIEAFTRPGGKFLSVSPSFAMYQVYANMYGREHIGVPYKEDLSFDVDDIITNITPDVDLVIVCNPNNPMGDAYTEEEMLRILSAAQANEATLLIDEAYHYFYPKSFLHLALEYDHVFVTRTFSKLLSMAGCRLGFAVGKAEGIELVQKLCTPYNVNSFSLKFAQAVLEEEGLLESLIARQKAGKAYLVQELTARGYALSAKEGNFLFLKPRTDADTLVRRMKEEKKILIKAYNGIGSLGKCLRLSTGEIEPMQQFLAALDELDK